LAGLFAFIRSNLCTREILLTLDYSGHHDWPDKRATLRFETLALPVSNGAVFTNPYGWVVGMSESDIHWNRS